MVLFINDAISKRISSMYFKEAYNIHVGFQDYIII